MDSIFGYTFKNEDLLRVALTTPSYRMQCPRAEDNQRLEFLGDAVLGILSAVRVYDEFPDLREGPLTVKRTHMVSAVALCEAAARHGLVGLLVRNKGAAPLPPNSKTIADAVEAIIGAAYIDGGFEAAQKVFDGLELTANAQIAAWSGNPKGELQVRVQAMRPPRHPAYKVIHTGGKAHDPIFTVRVTVDGVGEATAEAHNMKDAESRAAARLLAQIDGKATA